MSDQNLRFLFEIATLRNLDRSWRQYIGMDVESVLEHIVRVMFLALLIARKEGVKNEEKIMKMVLVHDLAETRTSDHMYVHKVYVKADEKKAADHLFFGTLFGDLRKDILHEYEERKSIEAKIVKDADNLECDMELKELEARGSTVRKKLASGRRLVRDKKLYTKTARKLWDAIQKADVDEWHLTSNKWLKIPNAGK
ncbi:MAG: HD domain-containing protein [Candidatus Pacebacteria bacterium]|nr:HD domain-containing protein [Candidatus Paceibacterota bacterium]MDD5356934.1 HD domain-containing protein [Candidatus Paceibacterota bacterium]